MPFQHLRSILFLWLLIANSTAFAVAEHCQGMFLLSHPPAQEGRFRVTEAQVIEILRQVQQIMPINVRNLRAKVDNPQAEAIIYRVTGYAKPLRTVYNFAKTLHPYEWWIEQLGAHVETVYKKRASLTEEEIIKGIQALVNAQLSVKIEAVRGNESSEYTAILQAALGKPVTANRLYLSTRATDKSWTQWTDLPLQSLAPQKLFSSNGLSFENIVKSVVQLKLAGFHTTAQALQGYYTESETNNTMVILKEVTGKYLRPSQIYQQYARNYRKTAWRLVQIMAQERINARYVHLLVASFEKPESWELQTKLTEEQQQELESLFKVFQNQLDVTEKSYLKNTLNYYGTHQDLDLVQLRNYLSIRLQIVDDQVLQSIFQKITQDEKLQQWWIQLNSQTRVY